MPLDGLMELIQPLSELLKMPPFVSIGVVIVVGVKVSRSAIVENITSTISLIQRFALCVIAQFNNMRFCNE